MSGCRAVYLDHVNLRASAGGQLSSQFSHLYLETLSREYNMPCSKSLFVDQFCAILAGEMGSTLTTSVYVAIRSVRVCPYVDPENWCKYLIWLHISLTLCRKNKSAQKRFSIFQNKKMQKKPEAEISDPVWGYYHYVDVPCMYSRAPYTKMSDGTDAHRVESIGGSRIRTDVLTRHVL